MLAAGGVPLRARRLQRDTLFDTEDGSLRSSQRTLRIRRDGDLAAITCKGAPQGGPMKVRQELETGVDDATTMTHVLEALGFRPGFAYEKYREEFSAGACVVAIDETPIGTFVEIEGDEQAIRALAAALGRGADDFIAQSYRSLFVDHCQRTGQPIDGPMLFPSA